MVIVALTAAADVPALADARAAGVLVRPDARDGEWLAAIPSDLALHAVLPNMAEFLRDAGERGFPTAALLRIRRASPAAWPALAVAGVAHLADLARQDFRGIVPILTALERAGLPSAVRRRLRSIALSSALTDLLLAAGHAPALAHWVDVIHRSGIEAHLETHNLGHLLRRLTAWRITPDAILGPLNPRGHRMKPTSAEVLAAVSDSRIPVIATDVCAAGTISADEGIAFALAQGAKAAVVDAADLRPRPR